MDKSGSKWSEIILAESAEDFWRMCGEMDPRSLCCNFTSLQKYVEWKYRTDPAEYASPAGVHPTYETHGDSLDGARQILMHL